MDIRAEYLKLMEAKRPGLLHGIVSALLFVCSLLYLIGFKIKYWLYKFLLKKTKSTVPVISVGNITCGGTGKTPFCEYLAKGYLRKGKTAIIVTRGYGKIAGMPFDDEVISASEKAQKFTRLTGKNKAELVQEAAKLADVAIIDDGFQSFYIKKDLDILLVDALNPFSNGKLLPAGFLREPVSAIKRAHIIILTRTNAVDKETLATLIQKIHKKKKDVPIFLTIHQPSGVSKVLFSQKHGITFDTLEPPDILAGKKVFAYCGIGNPLGFLHTLKSLKAKVVRFRQFPDHYQYKPSDIIAISAEASEFMADIIVTTSKDAIKIPPQILHDISIPIYIIKIEIKIVESEDRLWRLLDYLLMSSPTK